MEAVSEFSGVQRCVAATRQQGGVEDINERQAVMRGRYRLCGGG